MGSYNIAEGLIVQQIQVQLSHSKREQLNTRDIVENKKEEGK